MFLGFQTCSFGMPRCMDRFCDICANDLLIFLQAAHCRVETKAPVRGTSIFIKDSSSAPANVRLIQKMNMAKLMEMLRDSVRGPSL